MTYPIKPKIQQTPTCCGKLMIYRTSDKSYWCPVCKKIIPNSQEYLK